MRTFASVAEFVAAKGESLGFSEWHTITQDQVNAFADATGDHQWIHVDVERAASGPFGGTIAHGYLTLSLLPVMQMEIFSIRAEATLTDVRETPLGWLASIRLRVEVDGQQKAPCIADTLRLYVGS